MRVLLRLQGSTL